MRYASFARLGKLICRPSFETNAVERVLITVGRVLITDYEQRIHIEWFRVVFYLAIRKPERNCSATLIGSYEVRMFRKRLANIYERTEEHLKCTKIKNNRFLNDRISRVIIFFFCQKINYVRSVRKPYT